MAGPRVAGLRVADPARAWAALGFAVDDDGTCRVGATGILLAGAEDRRAAAGEAGITGWTLHGAAGAGPVDGIPTERVDGAAAAGPPAAHPNGALAVDHVVVATPDVARTVGALAATGMVLRRERRGGSPERPLHQAFFRHGEAVVEVVGPPEPGDPGPARLWGLTVTCADLDALAARLGSRLGTARPAVQPGRRIATLRPGAGCSVALAFMSPPPSGRGAGAARGG